MFNLIYRLIDVTCDRFVLLVAQALAARSDGLRNASKCIDAAIFLCRELLRCALLDAIN